MERVALITGASSGLGRALAVRMAREGWAVGLAARRVEALEAAAREVEEAGGRAAVLPCDVANRQEVRRTARACVDALGPVDLLVANAGVAGTTDVDELDVGEVERILRVNVMGAVHAVEAVLPSMLERDRGRLVAVSSLAGMGGLPRTAAYSASKAAMINFFESLRIDLRGRGVGVTVITPGYVRTPMTEGRSHAMPFMVGLDDAVERMWAGIRDGRALVAFPWPMAAFARLAQIFPRPLYDWIAGGFERP